MTKHETGRNRCVADTCQGLYNRLCTITAIIPFCLLANSVTGGDGEGEPEPGDEVELNCRACVLKWEPPDLKCGGVHDMSWLIGLEAHATDPMFMSLFKGSWKNHCDSPPLLKIFNISPSSIQGPENEISTENIEIDIGFKCGGGYDMHSIAVPMEVTSFYRQGIELDAEGMPLAGHTLESDNEGKKTEGFPFHVGRRYQGTDDQCAAIATLEGGVVVQVSYELDAFLGNFSFGHNPTAKVGYRFQMSTESQYGGDAASAEPIPSENHGHHMVVSIPHEDNVIVTEHKKIGSGSGVYAFDMETLFPEAHHQPTEFLNATIPLNVWLKANARHEGYSWTGARATAEITISVQGSGLKLKWKAP